jgi:hypothetical protein
MVGHLQILQQQFVQAQQRSGQISTAAVALFEASASSPSMLLLRALLPFPQQLVLLPCCLL